MLNFKTTQNPAQTMLVVSQEAMEEFAQRIVDEVLAGLSAQGRTNQSELPEYLTPGQACKVLGVSKPTLWRYEQQKVLIPVRIGPSVRYRKSDLANFGTSKNEAV